MGIDQQVEPKLPEVGVWPATMVESCSAPLAPMALAQNGTKAHPNPAIQRSERHTVTMFEVLKPAACSHVESGDDLRHAPAVAAMGFLPDVVLEFPPGKGQFSIALFNTLWKADRKEEALEEIKRFMSIANQDEEAETIKQYSAITQSILGK